MDARRAYSFGLSGVFIDGCDDDSFLYFHLKRIPKLALIL